MNFSLSTIQQQNRQRIDRYWQKHTKELYDSRNNNSKIVNLVEEDLNRIDWEGQTCINNGSIKKEHVSKCELVQPANSSIPVNTVTGGKKQSQNSLLNSVEISEIQTPNIRNLWSIDGSSQQIRRQSIQLIILQSGRNYSKCKIEGQKSSSKVLGRQSQSDKTITDLISYSVNSKQIESSLALGDYKSAQITKDINMSNKRDRNMQIGQFAVDETAEQSMLSKNNSTLHASKDMNCKSSSDFHNPITAKLLHHKYYSNHPQQQQTNTHVVDIPCFTFNKLPQDSRYLLIQRQSRPNPNDKILKIGKLLELSKNKNKRIAPDIATPQKYQSQPKGKLDVGNIQNQRKIKLKLMSVQNSQEKIDRRFKKLTDVYDGELRKNKTKVNLNIFDKQRNKPYMKGQKTLEEGFCDMCPFNIGKPCIDTGSNKVPPNKQPRLSLLSKDAEKQQPMQIYGSGTSILLQPQPSIQAIKFTHRGSENYRYRSVDG